MLNSYFKRKSTLTRYYETPAGKYLDEFTNWLPELGYQHKTILNYIRGAVHFSKWLQDSDIPIEKITSKTLNDFREAFTQINSTKKRSATFRGAKQYIAYLRFNELIVPMTPNDEIQHTLLYEFEQWMQDHRGVQDSTLKKYRRPIKELLNEFGENHRNLTAIRVRKYFFKHFESDSTSKTKTRVNAIRMLLRFLIATDRCDSNMDKVLPPIPHFKLQSLPMYIQPEEINLVIGACDDSTIVGSRDKAIILFLARIGLRACDVSGLKLDDIDWKNGTVFVIGKNRQETKLPLSQDVGDALLDYLLVRPPVNNRFIFITATAPWVGITASGVSAVAVRAIRRADIDAPFYGSHVFRHSAATALLRQGCSLETIGIVLRHASVETTAHYAKVDTNLLKNVIAPWPGGESC
ncbi:MAG: hypothetical protein COC04_06505 [Gammaproteobacteria bacterium]|nr:MAG: hypothetical protein COC04_06505 [Gammaproteobacteria bacterium]